MHLNMKLWQYPQTQIFTTLRMSNLTTQKIKMWQNSKTQILPTQTVKKIKNSNVKKIKMWQNTTPHFAT